MTFSLAIAGEHRYGMSVPAESASHRVSSENRSLFRVLVRLPHTGRVAAHTAPDVGPRGCAIARVQQHTERGRGVCQLVPLVAAATEPPSSDSAHGKQRSGAEYGRGVDARYLKRPTAGHVGGKGHIAHWGECLGLRRRHVLGMLSLVSVLTHRASAHPKHSPERASGQAIAPWHRTAHSAIDPTLVGMVDGAVDMCLRSQAWHESAVSP